MGKRARLDADDRAALAATGLDRSQLPEIVMLIGPETTANCLRLIAISKDW